MGQRLKETLGLPLNFYLLSRVMTPRTAFRYEISDSIIWSYRVESQLEISDNDTNLHLDSVRFVLGHLLIPLSQGNLPSAHRQHYHCTETVIR